MPVDIERTLADTEDFLRRLASPAALAAQKRKLKRGVGEALRRVRRAALIFVALLLGLVALSIAVGGAGFFAWLVALPAIFLAALVSLAWPTRAGRTLGEEPLAPPAIGDLAARCEDWLLKRWGEMPRPALPAVEAILERLHALQPHLAALPESDPTAAEARRLIGTHLPRLVDSFATLPPAERRPGSESSRRLAESLDIVADELARLCDRLEACRADSFAIEQRFIETRYREDRRLRGD